MNNNLYLVIMEHCRLIFPVGQGGFAIEMINEDYVVAYDCGSASSPEMLELSIDCISEFIKHIDLLFISHFDNDHVSGIRYLLDNITVEKAVTSFIPEQLKTSYGMYTDGAYSAIMELLQSREVGTIEIGAQDDDIRRFPGKKIWEWVAKSMMTNADFSRILAFITADGIEVERLQDAGYVEREKVRINKAFKSVFGSKGPNAKGLIMLSQPSRGTVTSGTDIDYGGCPCVRRRCIGSQEESSCLYVGDADLKNIANRKAVKGFWEANRTEDILLFMQIPHHGSRYNIDINLEMDFPARYYFVNDVNTNRLKKTVNLYTSLTNQNILLVTGVTCRDLIVSNTEI